MRILFVTSLTGNTTVGLSYSVPARIKAQEKIDDVLWVNLTEAELPHWKEVYCFHKLSEYGRKMSLDILPSSFNKPDLVVFEDFYIFKMVWFSYELRKKNIPYIVVPRSNLTYLAQHNHSHWKKLIFNPLCFSNFTKKALCIQYLSNEEYTNSTDIWNTNHIIIPNGINMPNNTKQTFSEKCIKAISISRIDAYHKGLDLLVQACKEIQEELRKASFSIKLYGKKECDYNRLNKTIREYGIEDIISFPGPVLGNEKETALMNADIFIQVSRLEGMPMGLLEAFSYGLPAVVSTGSNMADDVAAYHAGWTCQTDVQSIKYALLKAISEKEEFASFGCNSLKIAENYQWDKIALTFHNRVSELIS